MNHTHQKKKSAPEVRKEQQQFTQTQEHFNQKSYKKNTTLNNIVGSEPFSFDSVVSKWQGFVEEIANEKPLILGQFIHSLNPISLDGNKLSISSADSHVKDLLKTNEVYFAKKSMDFFGKKIIFKYIESNTINSDEPENPGKKISSKANGISSNEEDPYVSAIINDLGGEEIR